MSKYFFEYQQDQDERNISDSACSSEVISKIFNRNCTSSILARIAMHQNTSLQILNELIKSTSSYILMYVAMSSKLTPELIDALISNPIYNENHSIRYRLVKNSNISCEILDQHSKDLSWEIRAEVACRTNSVNVLEELCNDTISNVRANVAKNSNTPISILNVLKEDVVGSIRLLAIESINSKSSEI